MTTSPKTIVSIDNNSHCISLDGIDNTINLPNLIITPRHSIDSKVTTKKSWNIEISPERKPVYYQKYVTLIMIIAIILLSAYITTMQIIQIVQYKTYYAISILPLILLGMIFFSFAIKTVLSFIFIMILGPIKTLHTNSLFYSAIKSNLDIKGIEQLPPVIVNIPVYKESFDKVIQKTLQNVIECIDNYKCANGYAKIIVFDDGLQVIKNREKMKRINFYKKNGIGFIARCAENRRGLFKKASNLNHGLNICCKLTELQNENSLTYKEANIAYWKDNIDDIIGGDLSIPSDSIFLLLDADTKLPKNVITDTITEFIEYPELPYTQHLTLPFSNQCNNYWEGMIGYFTKKIFMSGIRLSTALGDNCPLVGHNAFIRWKDMREYANKDKQEVKYWSEETVSEDFEFFIRLAQNNKFGRYVTYTGTDFQEGVALSYIDEVIKMKKFTYGACEMCFNPIKNWIHKGLFSKIFVMFMWSNNIRWYQKISTCVYLSTYFALASSFYYMVAEGIISIMYPEFYDRYMVRSFDVMITCVLIFGIINVIGEIIIQWRLNALSLLTLWNEVKWIPLLALYFNSILLHLTEISFRYFWCLKAEWGSTVKEIEKINSLNALKLTLKCFIKEYICMSLLFSGYLTYTIIFNIGFYRSWSVLSYTSLHILGPIILNPYITRLNY